MSATSAPAVMPFENCDNVSPILCLLNIPARTEPMSKETETLSLSILNENTVAIQKNTGLKIKEAKLFIIKLFYKNFTKTKKLNKIE